MAAAAQHFLTIVTGESIEYAMNQNTEGQQHYFVEHPAVASRPKLINDTVAGVQLRLWTDRGCFSYGTLDTASRLLASTMVINADDSVLDWGCGYGFLGVMAAKLEPSCSVTMVEVNERAAELSRKNLIENQVSNAEVLHGAAPDALGDRTFDTIISNPPFSLGREVVEAMIRDALERLRPGGSCG